MPNGELLKAFLDASTPKNLRLMAARGLAPLVPAEMLLVLVSLAADDDHEVSQQARLTLREFSDPEILGYIQTRDCNPQVLAYLGWESESPAILEAIIQHPATPNRIIESLALTLSGPLLDTILDNRVRLLSEPGILYSLKINPAASSEIKRIVQEIESEFFGDKKKSYELANQGAANDSDSSSFLLQAEMPPEDLSLEGLPVDSTQREASLATRLSQLTVRQKIHHALLGTREERSILIRDSNKEVSRSVLHSPKLNESEVETFAGMRNISEDILRAIGNSREWTHNYSVIQNLIKNPKTPPVVSQRFLSRLQSRHLTLLARDRGIPEAVRSGAKRTLTQRSSRK